MACAFVGLALDDSKYMCRGEKGEIILINVFSQWHDMRSDR